MKRWSELKEAFWDLADREASDQQHRLALLASTDPEMHEQLHALLAADARGEQLLHPLDGLTRFAPNPPLRVGPYEIIGVLGVGGMGEVYRARDPRLHREVAVKVLPPAWVTDPQRLARFEREARVLAALNHPNIAAIYGFEAASPEGGSPGPALILELVEGETLGECIALRSREPNNMALTAGAAPQPASVHRSSPGLETSAALLIARQIAEALDAAHKKGIVHRDLKPANVKIGPDGTVKVLDFGLATAPMDTVDADPTRNLRISTGDAQEGFIAGTAGYMSPEQACGEAVDRRADIWAFGCVLYEMLTGRALCAAGALSDAFAAASECGPDWRALPDDTPEEIRRLLIRTLARDPEQRLGDIGDARRTIDAELAQRGQPGKATQQQNNLPLQASPLVGRQSELVEAGELLRKHRCLTLTGPGGSGKTRLALQLAASALENYRDGVWWVPLAALRDSELVLPEIARIVDARGDLTAHLRSRQLLLVLDNLEQIIACAPQLADLLAGAGAVRLLVTSREPLHIDGEHAYCVEPLVEDEAAALFNERAVVSEPQAAVREICRRVDCLPLAVELAAARTAVLPPEQLLARLGERLSLLTTRRRDAPARQQTLRATIQWSHDLLTEVERTLFRRLAVFVGGCTLSAAEEVIEADLDALQVLVDRNLVRRSSQGRFEMLETIGDFASEQLAADPIVDDLRTRHARFYLRLADRAAPHLRHVRQHEQLDELEREHPNLHATLVWSLNAGRIDWALRLCAALQFFWMYHSHITVGRRRVGEVLSADQHTHGRAAAELDPLRVPALAAASVLATLQNDYAAGEMYAAECLEVSRRLGDVRNEAGALLLLGRPALARGDPAGARLVLEQAVECALVAGDPWSAAMATFNLAYVALSIRDFEQATREMESALDQFRSLQDVYGVARSYAGLGAIAVHCGQVENALRALRESLMLGLTLGDREGPAWALELMADALAHTYPEPAARLMGAADGLREELGLTLCGAELEAHNRAIAAIRATTDEDVVEAALAAGRHLSLPDAVAFALERTAPPAS